MCKAAQVGGTTWAILRSIHACLQGLNVMYFFPTRTDVMEFSKARVNPLLADNPFLSDLMTDTDTAGLKRIGDAHLYLRGMRSTVGLKSVPADMVVFDELDEATPEAKTLARERLSHSAYKRIIELSNPSLPDFGIDAAYQVSDQRHWTVKCPFCGKWTALDKEFPTSLNKEVRVIRERKDGTFFRACPMCGKALDMAKGEWVADHGGRPIHGYLISQLISPLVDASEILEDYRLTRFPDHFYNLKIGIAWADLQRRLDAASVLSLCGNEPMQNKSDSPCSMGVDTGKALHVVILRQDEEDYDKQNLVHLAVCRDFSDLEGLIERFHVDRCVIDGLPETYATRSFASKHPGVVYMSFFNENQHGAPRWNQSDQKVDVNRTEALDASRAAVREKKVVMPRQDRLVRQFAKHMAADAKKLEEDEETGARKYRYIKTGENHLSFAFTYAWLAAVDDSGARAWLTYMRKRVQEMKEARR